MYVTCFYLRYSCYFWPSKLNFCWVCGGCISLHFGRNLNPQSREPWEPWWFASHWSGDLFDLRPFLVDYLIEAAKMGDVENTWEYLWKFFFYKYFYYSNWWIPSTRFWRWIFKKTYFHVLHLWGLGITAGVRLRRRVLAANRCGDPGW